MSPQEIYAREYQAAIDQMRAETGVTAMYLHEEQYNAAHSIALDAVVKAVREERAE